MLISLARDIVLRFPLSQQQQQQQQQQENLNTYTYIYISTHVYLAEQIA